MNYFEFYPGDYLRDTTRLSLTEHGAYLRLMCAYYSEETPLPADANELFIVCAAITPADRDAVLKVADRFFPIAADGFRRSSRADSEIAKAQKRIRIARENGAKRKPTGIPSGLPAGYPTKVPAGIPALVKLSTRHTKSKSASAREVARKDLTTGKDHPSPCPAVAKRVGK